MSTGDFVPGSIVEVPAGRGTVRFSGATDFAPGKWVGIELFEKNGKNNGSVNGNRYFNCMMQHGVFVRPSQVKFISSGEEVASPSPPSVSWYL